jgi:choline dehydrogenase-like flavoprotein
MAADYVIVGAGSAGCVLAARLSEDPDVEVLLLEAGGQDTASELHIPAMFPLVFKSGLDWDLFGEREPGLGGRRLYLPRGRVIGGSGSINAMIYLRGHRADFDGWAVGRLQRLVVRRGASLLQALRGQRARRERVPRRRRAAHGLRQPLPVPADRGAARGRRLPSGVRAHRGPERRSAEGGLSASSSRRRNGMRAAPPTRSSGPPRGGRTSRCARVSSSSGSSFEGDRAVGVELVRAASARPSGPSAR